MARWCKADLIGAVRPKMIHESAIIDPSANIADNVEIGAYSIIGTMSVYLKAR